MDLLPAIEIRSGRVVRIVGGDLRHAPTLDETDPVALAERFVMQGARWLHLVDLDRVFGDGDNSDLIGRIITRVGSHIQIQYRAGLRTLAKLESVQHLEVNRFLVPAPEVTDPGLIPAALRLLGPDRLAVALDARNGLVALRGWQETTTEFARDVAARLGAMGVRTIVYTDLARDGMLKGLDLVGATELQVVSKAGVLVSGGARTLDDLIRAKAALLAGVVVGRALFEGHFTIAQALTALIDA